MNRWAGIYIVQMVSEHKQLSMYYKYNGHKILTSKLAHIKEYGGDGWSSKFYKETNQIIFLIRFLDYIICAIAFGTNFKLCTQLDTVKT